MRADRGYAYRLCRKSSVGSKLNESCFAAGHLQFVGDKSWIQFGDDKANRTAIPAVRTAVGTNPPGSSWSKNPIPACGNIAGGGLHTSDQCKTAQFTPPLADVIRPNPKYAPLPGLYGFGMGHCVSLPHGKNSTDPGLSACSAEELSFWKTRFNFNIVDQVQVPAGLPAGDYLLSFRWDSEQTPQIWLNCADVVVAVSS